MKTSTEVFSNLTDEERILVTEHNITRLTEMLRRGLIKRIGISHFIGHIQWLVVNDLLSRLSELSVGHWVVYADNLSPINFPHYSLSSDSDDSSDY